MAGTSRVMTYYLAKSFPGREAPLRQGYIQHSILPKAHTGMRMDVLKRAPELASPVEDGWTLFSASAACLSTHPFPVFLS